MEERTLYLCDPEKHTGCKKRNCYLNPASLYHNCYTTADPACAITRQDGTMIVLPSLGERMQAQTKEEAP